MAKVYLAGGFYSDWRQKVMEGAPEHEYYDPEFQGSQTCIAKYTLADLDAIDWSNIVFAYLTSYPKYGGLAVEVGYAYAKEKSILLVTEKDDTDGMIVGLSKYVYLSLEGGIERLRRLN